MCLVLWCALLAALMLHSDRASTAENPNVPGEIVAEGEGEAAIVNQDVTAARKEALARALAQAFSKALSQAAPQGLSTAKQEELAKQLAPKQRDFLLRFRITSEMPAFQDFLLTVEATFSNQQIQEELARRGVIPKESAGEPVAVDLMLRGVSSFRMYQELVTQLPLAVQHVQSVQPTEVYGDQVNLRVLYRGDPRVFEGAVRGWLSETAWPVGEPAGEKGGLEFSVSLPRPDGKPGVPPHSSGSASKP